MMMKRLGALALVVLSGCLRSVADLPDPIEGGAISGTVVETDVASGQLVPVAGVRVALVGGSYSALTDVNGFFQLTRLPLDVFSLDFERNERGGRPAARKRVQGVRVMSDGQSVGLGLVQLTGAGDVRGAVYLEGDSDEAAAEGTTVVAAQTAFRAVVGRDGRFVLARLPEGDFEVAAFLGGYEPGRFARVAVAPLEAARDVGEVRLARDEGGAIEVRGLALLTGQTSSEGIEVRFFDELDPTRVLPPAQSSADGSFTLSVESSGVYRARFSKDGYRSADLRGVVVLRDGALGLSTAYLAPVILDDVDGDGIPDALDDDNDNDGCANAVDAFPSDPLICEDTDGDGVGDAVDDDSDDDGLSDDEENSPGVDRFVTDPLRADTDDDGAGDATDNCPIDQNPGQEDRDGDLRGDACDVEPVIDSFTPAQSFVGGTVRIFGRGFDPVASENLVRFGNGGANPAFSFVTTGTTSVLEVVVPSTAAAGQLRVITPMGTGTSSGALSLLEPPSIETISNTSVLVGDVVEVTGYHFANVQVSVGGVPAQVVDGPRPIAASSPPLEMFRFIVPQVATSGPALLAVTAPGGTATDELEIGALPFIDRFAHNGAVGPGRTIILLGSGLTPGGDLDPSTVRVDFNGAPNVEPTFVSATRIRVIVPMGAASGPLTVYLPTAPNGIMTPDLEIDPLLPAIEALRQPISRRGGTLTIIGTNFGAAAGVVSFVDAVDTQQRVEATPLTWTNDTITVTVPAAAGPGVVRVIRADLAAADSQDPLRLLERIASTTLSYPAGATPSGIAVSATGQVSVVLNNVLYRYDEDLNPATPASEPLAFLANVRAPFQASPNGEVGIFYTPTDLWVVDLPSFTVRAGSPCFGVNARGIGYNGGDTPPGSSAFSFDSATSYAYGAARDGVLRVKLDAPVSCEVLPLPRAQPSNDFTGVALDTSETRVSFAIETTMSSAFAFGTMNIDPLSPDYGVPNVAATTMVRDSSNLDPVVYTLWKPSGGFWAFPVNVAPWNIVEPALQESPFIDRSAQLMRTVVVVGDRRWLVMGGCAPSTAGPIPLCIVDLENSSVAMADEPAGFGVGEFGLAVHPDPATPRIYGGYRVANDQVAWIARWDFLGADL